METEALASLTKFGVAGLVGCMWMIERRAAAGRERQLEETHARLMQERTQLGVLMQALRDNTRALTLLEAGQRGLAGVLGRVGRVRDPEGNGQSGCPSRSVDR